TRPGTPSARASSASCADSNPRTAYPASRNAVASTKRTPRSSSTTQTVAASLIVRSFRINGLERQQQREHRMPRPRTVGERAAMLARHLLRKRKAQAATFWATTNQRQEHLLGQF